MQQQNIAEKRPYFQTLNSDRPQNRTLQSIPEHPQTPSNNYSPFKQRGQIITMDHNESNDNSRNFDQQFLSRTAQKPIESPKSKNFMELIRNPRKTNDHASPISRNKPRGSDSTSNSPGRPIGRPIGKATKYRLGEVAYLPTEKDWSKWYRLVGFGLLMVAVALWLLGSTVKQGLMGSAKAIHFMALTMNPYVFWLSLTGLVGSIGFIYLEKGKYLKASIILVGTLKDSLRDDRFGLGGKAEYKKIYSSLFDHSPWNYLKKH